MTDRKRKRCVIYISSSSSSDEEEEEEEESKVEEIDDDDEYEENESEVEEIDAHEYEEDESEAEENDDDRDEETSGDAIATDCSEEDEEKELDNTDDDEAFCERVICLLRDGKDLGALSLKECKAYLRKHRLRLGGSKDVCIHRIKEHWRINEGNSESFYPRSSFVINCTGDVCKGDVVLFRQKVYAKFDKVTRNGNVFGMRTVAGRVVKESYGSAKQQHTFTVEVLWSKGTKKLSLLFPLLVKGRNLYKLKTFRQRWNNEAERIQVLAEKHKRGAAARAVRALKISKKHQSSNRHLNEGRKHQKCSNHKRQSQSKKTPESLKGAHAYGREQNTSKKCRKINNQHQEVSSSRQLHLNGIVRSGVGHNPNWRHSKNRHMNMEMDPGLPSHAYSRQDTFHCKWNSITKIYHLNLLGITSARVQLCFPLITGTTFIITATALKGVQGTTFRNQSRQKGSFTGFLEYKELEILGILIVEEVDLGGKLVGVLNGENKKVKSRAMVQLLKFELVFQLSLVD